MAKKKHKISVVRKSGDSKKLNPATAISTNQKIQEGIKQKLTLLLDSLDKLRPKIKPSIQSAVHTFSITSTKVKPLIFVTFAAIRKLKLWKKLIFLSILLVLILAIVIKHYHSVYYSQNVIVKYRLFIHDGDNFDQVCKQLKENNCLADLETFTQVAKLKDYNVNIKPGAYLLEQGWNNNQLVNTLRSGAQAPVMVIFNNIRTLQELAGKLAKQLQSDSISFLNVLKNDSNALKLGFKPESLPALFIPNTYSFYWTTSPSGFLTRMKREYDLFWNEARKLKAKALGLTSEQVSTLASIVQEECNKNDEKPIIAGVYLNRLRKNWPLQADPTIRFALQDFTIRRILTTQLAVESPYNTYKNAGLPPGPINLPEISSLEAVLNSQAHDFYYFCAKEDFSGYHNFAKTLSEHNRNARKYQTALNKMKVFK